MKRAGNLHLKICSWENLELAANRARKRKRYRHYAEQFELRRESNLRDIRNELLEGRWRPQEYHEFKIYEPKERTICAAPYRDRVVHHAVCNIIGPILEKKMVDQSHACRIGKGTGSARRDCQRLVKKYRYVLKADIRKYFPSIDHEVLKQKLRRAIKCRETLALLDLIVESWRTVGAGQCWFEDDDLFDLARCRGIPIGNLTSQLFANYYLDRIDHYILQELKPKGYIRYTDDFLLFSNSKSYLRECLHRIGNELTAERLKLHDAKCRVFPVGTGVPFLGFRFFPDRVRVLRENRLRFEKRMRKIRENRKAGNCAVSEIWQSMYGWFQFVREYPANEGLVISECDAQKF